MTGPPARLVPAACLLTFAAAAASSASLAQCHLLGEQLVSPCWEIRLDVSFYALLACAIGISVAWGGLRLLRIRMSYGAAWGRLPVCLWPITGAIFLNLMLHLFNVPDLVPALVWVPALAASVYVAFHSFIPQLSRTRATVAAALCLLIGLILNETCNGSIPVCLNLAVEKRPQWTISKVLRAAGDASQRAGAFITKPLGKYVWLVPSLSLPELAIRPSPRFTLEIDDADHSDDMPNPTFPTHIRLNTSGLPAGKRVSTVRFELGGKLQTGGEEDPFNHQTNLVKLRFDEQLSPPRQELRVREVVTRNDDGREDRYPVTLSVPVVGHRPIATNNAMHGVLDAVRLQFDADRQVENRVWEHEIELGNQLLYEFFPGAGPPPREKDLQAWVLRYSEILTTLESGLWNEETEFEPYEEKTRILRFMNLPSVAYARFARAYLDSRRGAKGSGLDAGLTIYRLATVVASANNTLVHWINALILTSLANRATKFWLAHEPNPESVSGAIRKLKAMEELQPRRRSCREVQSAEEVAVGEESRRLTWSTSWHDPFFHLSAWLRSVAPSQLCGENLEEQEAASRTGYSLNKAFLLAIQFRNVHGRYPESLSEAAESLGLGVPMDEFAHSPISYEKTTQGFRLHSFGPDEDDDRGEKDCPEWEGGPKTSAPDCDWVLKFLR